MTTLHTTKPPRKGKAAQAPPTVAHRFGLAGRRLLLTIIACRPRRTDVDHYLFTPIPGDFGPAFRLQKCAADGSPWADADGPYDVCLAGHGSCECLGYLRHGRCKHLAVGREMQASGEVS